MDSSRIFRTGLSPPGSASLFFRGDAGSLHRRIASATQSLMCLRIPDPRETREMSDRNAAIVRKFGIKL